MSPSILGDIHQVVYDRQYDVFPTDWIEALVGKDNMPQKTDRFWCSDMVGYIYTSCGVLDSETDWSLMSPNDFSLTSDTLHFISNCALEPNECSLKSM